MKSLCPTLSAGLVRTYLQLIGERVQPHLLMECFRELKAQGQLNMKLLRLFLSAAQGSVELVRV